MNILKIISLSLCAILIALGAILFALTLGPQYDKAISGVGVASDASAIDRAAPDPIYENWVNDGFMKKTVLSNGSIRYVDSVYFVDRTWKGAWVQGKTDGSRSRFTWGFVITLSFSALFIILTVGGAGEWTMVLMGFAILLGGPLMGSGFQWNKWNSTRQIKKSDYLMYMGTGSETIDGRFWDLPAKSL